jgi:hypothetical protein
MSQAVIVASEISIMCKLLYVLTPLRPNQADMSVLLSVVDIEIVQFQIILLSIEFLGAVGSS